MGIPQEKREGLFTYRDYLGWPEEERWELIDGVAYDMSPAPNRYHQQILSNLAFPFLDFFRDKTCEVYLAPFDVVLPEEQEDEEDADTVIQPDVSVICDASKLTDRGCTGAPDLVLEILNPSTAYRDVGVKLRLYESNGVKEYWVVNPAAHSIMVYNIQNSGRFGKPRTFNSGELAASEFFPGLTAAIDEVFRGIKT